MDTYLDGMYYVLNWNNFFKFCLPFMYHSYQYWNQKPVDSNVSTVHAAVGHFRKIIYHVPSQKEDLEERTLKRFICSFVTAKFWSKKHSSQFTYDNTTWQNVIIVVLICHRRPWHNLFKMWILVVTHTYENST